MTIYSLYITRPWHIYFPVLFRYLEQEYIDAFFRDGSLRLSSFKQFAKHKDEARNDWGEGKFVFEITHEKTMMSGIALFGSEAYALSASLVESPDLMNIFGYNGYFKINDPAGFGIAIASQLAGFSRGFQGPCFYSDSRPLKYASEKPVLEPWPETEEEKEKWGDESRQMMHEETKLDPYFVKATRYASQNEYRLLWCISGNVDNYIDIKCPEAIRFCTKIT
jgi:hypothetical protein